MKSGRFKRLFFHETDCFEIILTTFCLSAATRKFVSAINRFVDKRLVNAIVDLKVLENDTVTMFHASSAMHPR